MTMKPRKVRNRLRYVESTTRAPYVLIRTRLFEPFGGRRRAILRYGSRHDWKHPPGEASEAHGRRGRPCPRQARDDEPGGQREGSDRRADDPGRRGERAPEAGRD